MVAVLAHALGVIRRDVFHVPCNPDEAATVALFHDSSEILTGDLPTPVKYHSDNLRRAYKQLESLSADRLLTLLPGELRRCYAPYLKQESGYAKDIVKAADKISAYIKCLQEQRAGNPEFDYAAENIRAALDEVDYPEVQDFRRDFLPAFEMTLDELNHPSSEE